MSRKNKAEQDQPIEQALDVTETNFADIGPEVPQVPEPETKPEDLPMPDEAAIDLQFRQITTEEFESKREDLISAYKDDPEIGDNTLNAMIADLLGFTQCGQKWTPCKKYAMRREEDGSENTITIYRCPAGLYTVAAELTSDRVDDNYERARIAVDEVVDITSPATDIIRDVVVFDSETEALSDIYKSSCLAIHGHIGFGTETMDWLSDVFLGVVKPEPLEEEELPENEPEAAEEKEGPQYKSGEQMPLNPEVFPTEQSLLTSDKNTIIEKLNIIKAKLKSEEEDMKEIKAEQKNAFTMEINSKKQNIEMLERLDNYFEILKAVADAKVQSALSDCTIITYTTPCSKGKWVHIGTGQDVLEAKVRYGHGAVFEVAAFEKGKQAGAENGDYPNAPDPEDAAQNGQEGGKLSEEEEVSGESEEGAA